MSSLSCHIVWKGFGWEEGRQTTAEQEKNKKNLSVFLFNNPFTSFQAESLPIRSGEGTRVQEEAVEKEVEKKTTKKRRRQADKPQQEAKRHTFIHIHTVCLCVFLRGRLHDWESERERKGGRVTWRLGEPPPSSSSPLPLFLFLPPLPPPLLPLSLCGAGV